MANIDKRQTQGPHNNLFFNSLLILMLLALLSFVIIEALIIKESFSNDNVEVDYVVVLGAGLFGDKPSPALQNRLNTALNYIKAYPDVRIVVTGGQGPNELITEAAAMERFLLEKGVKKEQILKEEKSTNTKENLLYTKKILENYDLEEDSTILIVTNEFHVFRSKFLARRYGFIPYAKSAPSPTYPKYLKFYFFLREYFAVIKSLIFD